MSKKADYQVSVNRAQLHRIAKRAAASESLAEFAKYLRGFLKRLPADNRRGTWRYYTKRLIKALDHGNIPFSVFVRGNGKLPFRAFSVLPIVSCPGAGSCLTYCYSLRAWRYPAAFYRQVCNTLRMRFAPEAITKAWRALPRAIDVRLYVDGDLSCVADVAFWQARCAERSDLRAYGYSKSWKTLVDYSNAGGAFAPNYALNLSNGGCYENNADIKAQLLALRDTANGPVVRGEFVAVPISGHYPRGFARYQSADYHVEVRQTLRHRYGKRSASCGGQCGACGNAAHWCGDKRNAIGLTIGIGIH